MKKLLVLAALGLLVYMGYQKYQRGPAPTAAEMENPVYGEMRVNTTIEGRELEMALFVKVPDKEECQARARQEWADVLKDCPGCKLQAIKCQDTLSPRYARLFEDTPIPSAYLSLKAGNSKERDGRLVVYGLTDQEGVLVCEEMRRIILKEYKGTGTCIAPSGG
jgi:hypothetical protein